MQQIWLEQRVKINGFKLILENQQLNEKLSSKYQKFHRKIIKT